MCQLVLTFLIWSNFKFVYVKLWAGALTPLD